MDWIVTPKIHFESLTPHLDGVFKVKWGHKCGGLIWIILIKEGETPELNLSTAWGHRRWLSASQEERSQQESNSARTELRLSRPQNCEKINVVYLYTTQSVVLFIAPLKSPALGRHDDYSSCHQWNTVCSHKNLALLYLLASEISSALQKQPASFMCSSGNNTMYNYTFKAMLLLPGPSFTCRTRLSMCPIGVNTEQLTAKLFPFLHCEQRVTVWGGGE